jgi:hypothetical protein
VTYESGLYRALQETTGNAPTSATHWEKVGDYASLGEAVAAHAAQLEDHETRVTSAEGAITAEAEARTLLATQVGSNAAAIQAEAQTRATETGALSTQITAVVAQYQAADAAIEARFDVPAYDDAAIYAPGDPVLYDGAVYQALLLTQGVLPTDATYWTKLRDLTLNTKLLAEGVLGAAVRVEPHTTLMTEVFASSFGTYMLGDINLSGGTRITAADSLDLQKHFNGQAVRPYVDEFFLPTILANPTKYAVYFDQGLSAIAAERAARTAAVQTAVSALADADGALAESITTVVANYQAADAATLTSAEGYADSAAAAALATAEAAVQAEATARANADGALATQITTVSTTVGGNTSAIQTQATAINGLSAQYTIKVQAGGIAGGIGLAAEAPDGSEGMIDFAVRANRFYVAPPEEQGDTKTALFTHYTTPTEINGVEIPAGTYMDAAFMRTFVAQKGQIGALAVDDAAIANLSAAKLTAGDGTIGGILKSANYVSGVSGWAVHPTGWAEFANATVRGTVYADTGWFKGQIIGGNATTYASGAGMWTGVDEEEWKFRLGSSDTYLRWDGESLTLRGTLTIEDGSGNVLLSSGSGVPWDKISGVGKPENGATVGAPAGTLVAGVPAANVATAVTDFNASNNRNSAAIAAPAIATDGTAVEHVAQKDGSVDISFEWAWDGNEGDIDGFLVFVRQSASATAYTFGTTPAEETVYTVPANKRAFVLFGVAADKYYTFGVQAYRAVDKVVNAAGVIKSTLVKATGSGENPYRPSTSVEFSGDVTGTIDGTLASTLVTNASTALTRASAAQADATKALNELAGIAADNKLTPAEKKSVRKEWDTIYAERAGIRAQADSFGITTEKTNYDNDFQALGTYLNGGTAYTIGATPPSWITDENLAVTTTIVGTTFRANWSNLYADRQALLNKISAEAAKRADWASVSGTGKPADGATVGADWGSNLTGKPTDAQLLNNLLDPSKWYHGAWGTTLGTLGFNMNGGKWEN